MCPRRCNQRSTVTAVHPRPLTPHSRRLSEDSSHTRQSGPKRPLSSRGLTQTSRTPLAAAPRPTARSDEQPVDRRVPGAALGQDLTGAASPSAAGLLRRAGLIVEAVSVLDVVDNARCPMDDSWARSGDADEVGEPPCRAGRSARASLIFSSGKLWRSNVDAYTYTRRAAPSQQKSDRLVLQARFAPIQNLSPNRRTERQRRYAGSEQH